MPRSFENGQPTSEEANILASPFKDLVRNEVWSYLANRGEQGATDQELEVALDRPGNTLRPARREQVKLGIVVESGRTRRTRSGRRAIVWILARFAAGAG